MSIRLLARMLAGVGLCAAAFAASATGPYSNLVIFGDSISDSGNNALLPLSTMIAFALSGLMEGAFFVETLTGIPGAGRLAIESIGGRDYDMIMAFTIITATAFVMTSIFIDIAYTFIDPRIRYGARRN